VAVESPVIEAGECVVSYVGAGNWMAESVEIGLGYTLKDDFVFAKSIVWDQFG
jgi:hypothetical protein